MTLGVAFAAQAADQTPMTGEPQPSMGASWGSQLQQANQLVTSAPEQARVLYEDVLHKSPQGEGARQAIEGIAETYVATHDYDHLTQFLESQIQQDRAPAQSSAARDVYSRVATNVDTAHINAYRQYQQVQSDYDNISWFNVFRIFEKFRLKNQLSEMKRDLDQITEVKLRFNPAYVSPGGGRGNNGGFDSYGKDDIGGPGGQTGQSLPPPTIDPKDLMNALPPPGGTAGTLPGEIDGVRGEFGTSGGGSAGLGPIALPSPGASPAPSGIEGQEEADIKGSGTLGASGASGALGSDLVTGQQDTDKVISDVEAKLKAVQLLKGELQQILALIPEDRRPQARDILVNGGGFNVANMIEKDAIPGSTGATGAGGSAGAGGASGAVASSGNAGTTASTGSAGAAGTAGSSATEQTGSTGTAGAGGSSGTDVASSGAGGASGTTTSTSGRSGTSGWSGRGGRGRSATDLLDPTEDVSASTIDPVVVSGSATATSGAEGTSGTAGTQTAASSTEATAAQPAGDPNALKAEMEQAYSDLLGALRTQNSAGVQTYQQKYIDAMGRYRAATNGAPSTTAVPAPNTSGNGTAASGTQPATNAGPSGATTNDTTSTQGSEIDDGSGVDAGTAGSTGASTDASEGPVYVNTQAGSNGRPLSDQSYRNIRSGLSR